MFKSSWTLGVATWTCSYGLQVVGACIITKFAESRSALWTWSPTKTRETWRKKIMCAINLRYKLDLRGSVYHSTIHTQKSNKMQQCIEIYYSIFIWSPTCFGRHTVLRQEPKTALAGSGLHTWKVVGHVIAGRCQSPATTRPTTFHVCKPEAASAVLDSWRRAVCHPKHVGLHINME